MSGAPKVFSAPLPETVVRPTTMDDLIERKRRELLELEARTPDVVTAPVLVTAVIPVRDAFMTLGRTLSRLAPGAQSVPIDVILVDGGSRDPCRDVLSGDPHARIVEWATDELGLHSLTVLPPVAPITRRQDTLAPLTPSEFKHRNIEWLEKKLTLEVKTRYVLYIDSDVKIPVDCVRHMIEIMDLDEKLAMAGVLYDWSADHVKFGCALARMDVMKDFDFRSDAGCPCRWTNEELKRLGWKVAYVPPELVYRDGYGPIRMDGTHERYNWR